MLNDRLEEGLTFDDVILIPARSAVLPRGVDTRSRLTRRIEINIPITSAAMDTVSDSRMAIAMAREGGIGIVHRAMPPKDQATEVDRVKKSESGMIHDPITIAPDQTIREAAQLMTRYRISGVPVTRGAKLVGIVTNRDLRFENRMHLKVSEVMTRKGLITAPEGTSLEQAKAILQQHKIEKLPVVNKEFELKGLITIKDIEKKIQFPLACKDPMGRLRVGAAVGVGDEAMERVELLVAAGVDVIVVDTAHGHSESVLDAIRQVRKAHPELALIGGNIATAEATRDLVRAGVDAVKVGVGPGSICTTRIVAGAGVPQLTAIANCAPVAHRAGVSVIADGGIKFSGDVTKAIAAGADIVMIGSLFAGTEESPGEVVLLEGRSYKVYRGMGSLSAMGAGRGSRERYFQEGADELSKLVPAGIEGRVPFKGPLAASVFQMVGGLRAGMGYCGVENIEGLRRLTHFVRVSNAGHRESHPHDVTITKEAPNYEIR